MLPAILPNRRAIQRKQAEEAPSLYRPRTTFRPPRTTTVRVKRAAKPMAVRSVEKRMSTLVR